MDSTQHPHPFEHPLPTGRGLNAFAIIALVIVGLAVIGGFTVFQWAANHLPF